MNQRNPTKVLSPKTPLLTILFGWEVSTNLTAEVVLE